MIGQTVSRYKVIEKLGEGGMGVVYRAEDVTLGRSVAIKFLTSLDRHYRARFLREARAVSALTHPNIAAVYEYGETEEGQPYIVMELVKGKTLSQMLDGDGLTLGQSVEITASIAEALGEAHRHGIVHRDVKPSNIVVTERGQVKVLDMISRNAPISEILNSLVLLIEAQSPEMLCSVLLLSPDGNHMQHGAAPSLPEQYVKAVDGAPIGPKNGSCGTAMYRGTPVIVTDIFSDPLWDDYRDLTAGTGLRACWSTPIMSKRGKVLGSFAMYYRQPQAPSAADARLTNVATHLASVAIEHQKKLESTQQS